MPTLLPDELCQAVAEQAGLSRPLTPSTLFRYRSQLSSNAQAGSRQTGREAASAIASLAERYRVTGANDDLGDCLDDALQRMVKASQVDEGELRIERLPDALHFLTLLAAPPSQSTLHYADDLVYKRNQPSAPAQETWADLVTGAEGADEWKSSSAPRYASSSSDDDGENDLSSSSGDSDDFPPTPNPNRRAPRRQGKGAAPLPTPRPPPSSSPLPTLTPNFTAHDLLLKGQYWSTFRPLPPSVSATEGLKAGDPNSLAGALMAAEGGDAYAGMGKSYWSEVEAVREVVGALQGRADGGLFGRSAVGRIEVSRSPPSLLHLSPSSFTSLLSTFLPSLRTLAALSSFLSSTLHRTVSSLPRGWGHTVEAFAQDVERCVLEWKARWAAKELELLQPKEDVVISLLALSEEAAQHLPLLDVLLAGIDTISPSSSLSPALSSATLLNTLLLSSSHYSSIASHDLASQIQRVWLSTAEPSWRALGGWVREGRMPSGTGMEFWIKRNEEVELEDGEYFREGFALLGSEEEGRSVPAYLKDFAEDVLECGKAVGLLKALLPGDDWVDGEMGGDWPTLNELMGGKKEGGTFAEEEERQDKDLDAASIARRALLPLPSSRATSSAPPSPSPIDTSTSFADVLALSTSTLLSPIFQTIHSKLHRVVVEECRLLEHLRAIQGVYLMRKGWELGVWCGGVWEKMDRGHLWTDFQLLNSTWARAVAGADWIDSTAFRFRVPSAAGASRTRQMSTRSVRVFEKLGVEYNIPWPLIYAFRPETMTLYSTIFTFLLQLRRAKHLIDRLSLIKPSTDLAGLPRPDHELRAYYALRRKLGWLVGVLFEFMMSFIEEEVGRFEEGVKGAGSLKEWVERHEKHVEGLRDRLLLNQKALPIHRSIISILDLCITLSDTWTTLNGDTTFDTSRRGSLVPHRRQYNKRQLDRRRRRAACLSKDNSDEEDESTEDDESDDGLEEGETTTFGGGGASGSFVSFADEGFGARIRRIESDLDGHQGFVRRGVEGLARNAGGKEVREVYGLLAVRLSDWM